MKEIILNVKVGNLIEVLEADLLLALIDLIKI
jgi:hypothetical protein